MASTKPAHLEPSELGSKGYWDTFYSADLKLSSSPAASLDGWFSDVDATGKILGFLSDPSLHLDLASTRFLDLGTGNGELLFHLREEGSFSGRMVGVDYSPSSIQLAQRAASTKNLSSGTGFEFQLWDIIHDDPLPEWLAAFDVVLDKGTFDAISLSGEVDNAGQRICEGYRAKVERLVAESGMFVITSCNWTEAELRKWFEDSGSSLRMSGRIMYPSFTFGGATGQSISTLSFIKQAQDASPP